MSFMVAIFLITSTETQNHRANLPTMKRRGYGIFFMKQESLRCEGFFSRVRTTDYGNIFSRAGKKVWKGLSTERTGKENGKRFMRMVRLKKWENIKTIRELVCGKPISKTEY